MTALAFVILFYVGIGLLYGAWAYDAYVQNSSGYKNRADNAGGKWNLALLAGVMWPGVLYFWIKGKLK